MYGFVLTGFNRGLGQSIHEQLLHKGNRNKGIEFFFIARKDCGFKSTTNTHYMSFDMVNCNNSMPDFKLTSNLKEVFFINNAGTIEPISPALKIDGEHFEKILRINCIAPFLLAKEIVKQTKVNQQKLTIVNISTGAINRPIAGWMGYCSSKLAAKMVFDVIALENSHVDVIHFDPGVMNTDMQKQIRGQTADVMFEVESFKKFYVDKQLKSPDDVAKEVIQIIDNKIRTLED